MACEPGWEWISPPRKFQIGRTWGSAGDNGVIVHGDSVVDAEGGVLRIHCVQTRPGGIEVDVPQYRVVLFDADGNRYMPDREEAGGFATQLSNLQHAVFTLGPQTLTRVQFAYLGVEQAKPAQPLGDKTD